MRVALLQMASHAGDVAANRKKAVDFCRRADAEGAALALFPEMWSVGYSRGFDPALAEPVDGPFVSCFRDLAAELGMAIGVTWLERWRAKAPPRNSLALFDARGGFVLHYSKVHLCPWGPPDDACAPGAAFPVATLATREGNLAVGAMICFDREQPESARVLSLGGAELILVPNSCTLDEGTRGFGDVRLAQLRARAFENGVAVAMANYAAPEDDGHSCAYHPDGGQLVMADGAEGIVLADVDLARVRRFRSEEAGRVRARRPERYGAITRRPRG